MEKGLSGASGDPEGGGVQAWDLAVFRGRMKPGSRELLLSVLLLLCDEILGREGCPISFP